MLEAGGTMDRIEAGLAHPVVAVFALWHWGTRWADRSRGDELAAIASNRGRREYGDEVLHMLRKRSSMMAGHPGAAVRDDRRRWAAGDPSLRAAGKDEPCEAPTASWASSARSC